MAAAAAEDGKQRKDGGRGGGRRTGLMDGFCPVMTPPSIFWNSRRKRSGGANVQNPQLTTEEEESPKAPDATGGSSSDKNEPKQSTSVDTADDDAQMAEAPFLTERRKALFDPLDPPLAPGGKRMRAEDLLPPPDFDSVAYPKGWLVGKKRKLVNVDVVESMRRIAVQEMNRKDREIDGLNEQLEEDARCLERLQLQLLEERSKRADVERQNAMLQNQVSMLMEMMQEAEPGEGEGEEYQYEAHEP